MQPEHEFDNKRIKEASGGEVFDNNFQLLELLGSGGFSAVYRARQKDNGRIIALKVLHAHLVAEEMSRKRFLRELELLSGMTHKGIATVFQGGFLQSGQPYIALELIKGNSLGEHVVTSGPLRAEQAISIFEQTCDALAAAHSREVLHRDLKPANLILTATADGKFDVKLLDFGLARPMGRLAFESSELTIAGETVGTPPYMSPEQCTGKELDGRSDVYSLGCVMYEALSGNIPFTGTVLECMQKQLSENPPPFEIKASDPETAAALSKVLLKALQKKPANRYQSMRHMRQDMLSCLSGSARAPLASMQPYPSRVVAAKTETTATASSEQLTPVAQLPTVSAEKEPLKISVPWLVAIILGVVACLAAIALK